MPGRFLRAVLLGVPLLVVPAGAAPAAATSPPRVEVLAAKLADRSRSTVEVGTTVTCPPGGYGTVYMTLSQVVRHEIAGGTGQETLGACTGSPQAVVVRIEAAPGGPVFRAAEAAVATEFFVFCGHDTDCVPPRHDTVVGIRS